MFFQKKLCFESNKQCYTILGRAIKENAHKEKLNFINNLATYAEAAARIGNSKTLYHNNETDAQLSTYNKCSHKRQQWQVFTI